MSSFWSGRRLLVTGHTGFKGAWLSLWLHRLGAQVSGLALPAEDLAGAFPSLGPWPGLDSHILDLRDADGVVDLVEDIDPEVVFHLGAQALVRRGYSDPFGTYATNVVGTANLLHGVARAKSLLAVVVVTSDKVYANAGLGRPFREDDPLGGGDPYSSSKAVADLLTRSWRSDRLRDGAVAIGTARAGNAIGGGDRGEDRLLPDAWRALEAGERLLVRNPDATRPWQFVLEALAGYLLLGQRLATEPARTPRALNFGPDARATRRVADVLERVFQLWGTGGWDTDASIHPPEAASLSLDAGLATEMLGWRPRLSLDIALDWTVQWWRCAAEGGDLRQLALGQIASYESLLDP